MNENEIEIEFELCCCNHILKKNCRETIYFSKNVAEEIVVHSDCNIVMPSKKTVIKANVRYKIIEKAAGMQ